MLEFVVPMTYFSSHMMYNKPLFLFLVFSLKLMSYLWHRLTVESLCDHESTARSYIKFALRVVRVRLAVRVTVSIITQSLGLAFALCCATSSVNFRCPLCAFSKLCQSDDNVF